MQRSLGAKNKLKSIDGSTEVLDEDHLNFIQWQRCNHLILSWIINLVSGQIASTILFHENFIDAWKDLHERFSKAGRICIVTLRTTINSLKQNS